MPSLPEAPLVLAPSDVVARAFASLGIALDHDAATEAEAAAWRERPGLDDPALEDLDALAFVTIDNPGSRDLDQALHIERDGTDYRVRYALADASHYVRPDSALFASALARGASYYTPGAVAPMLPRTLSEDLVSLEPGVARRALVFDMRLDAAARVLGTRVLRARIRSRAQLTYRGVQAFLDGEPRTDEPIDDDWAPTLHLLREAGTRLLARARERGVVPFDRREAHVVVAGSPPRFVARERERLEVEEWNAQVSLLCNAEGATLLAGLDGMDDDGRGETDAAGEDGNGDDARGDDERRATGAAGAARRPEPGGTLQAVYRVHDAPLPARLAELRARLDEWATLLGLDDVWRWGRDRTLADYLDALPDAPRDAGRRRAVQRQVLIRQRASEFRAERGRHHALALEGYARFSSPMREVVGIFTHEELLETLEGRPDRDTARQDAVIESANAAKRRQKALDKAIGFAVIADLLEADLAREDVPARTGTVLGVREGSRERSGHLHVALEDFALDVKVYAEDLERRHGTPYAFGALSAVPEDAAKPAFVLGDTISVRSAGYDRSRERFTLDAVPKGEAARRERRRARQG